ncbi:MAG: FAD-dependent oxidoreductase [Gemmatimonadota bacterium]
MDPQPSNERVVVIGAGPIGLEAALALAESGREFVLFEAGPDVGANVTSWGHVALFTPWSMNVSPRARRMCAAHGVELPAGGDCPTGDDLVREMLKPIARLPAIAPHVECGTRVLSVGREGQLKNTEIGTGVRSETPLRLLVEANGEERIEYATTVLDCTGTWDHPNALGASGIPAPGERAAEGRIERGIPRLATGDALREGWSGAHILLVGAGHSAQTAAGLLADFITEVPSSRVTWLMRNPNPAFESDPDDPLPARRALVERAAALAAGGGPVHVRSGVAVEGLARSADGLTVHLTGGESLDVDAIVSLTGSVGDASLYRQLQVHECYATSGPMKLAAALLSGGSADCLEQEALGAETLKNPEPNFYILGSKSYGRTNTFLLRVGWEQVDEVLTLLPVTS